MSCRYADHDFEPRPGGDVLPADAACGWAGRGHQLGHESSRRSRQCLFHKVAQVIYAPLFQSSLYNITILSICWANRRNHGQEPRASGRQIACVKTQVLRSCRPQVSRDQKGAGTRSGPLPQRPGCATAADTVLGCTRLLEDHVTRVSTSCRTGQVTFLRFGSCRPCLW